MSRESFSPESTNPRIRRSFAHAKINTAIASGKPEDKLAAVEAATAASKTVKGIGFGRQAVSAILNSTPPVLEAWDPHAIDDVYPGRGYAGWTSGDFVRHYDVVQEALGIVTGVVHRKLETASEYRVAADIIYADAVEKGYLGETMPPSELASIGERQQLQLQRVDWSIPGTLRQSDAVRAIMRDSSPLLPR